MEQKEKKYTGYGYHGGGRKPKGEEPKLKSLQRIAVYQFPVLFLQQ